MSGCCSMLPRRMYSGTGTVLEPAGEDAPATGGGSLEHEDEDEVDDEEEDDGGFEDEHPAVGLVVLEELVEVVEGADFFVNESMPFAEVEARGDGVMHAGEVPVADKFGDVGKFVAEAGEV